MGTFVMLKEWMVLWTDRESMLTEVTHEEPACPPTTRHGTRYGHAASGSE